MGPILGYAMAAGAGALLVAIGALIGSLIRWPEFTRRPAVLGTSILTASSSSGKALAIGGNSPASPPAAALPTRSGNVPAAPAVVAVGPASPDTATHRRVAKPGPGRSRLPAGTMPGDRIPVEKSDEFRTAAPIRYCAQVDETVFRPAGLDEVTGRTLRCDAGFMRMIITVPEDAAADGHPAFASVFFENGGDSSVLLDRLEVTSSKGVLAPVSGAALPARVAAGGLKEIYRYPLTLFRGETDGRQFVVVDRNGDSWGATLRLVHCEN